MMDETTSKPGRTRDGLARLVAAGLALCLGLPAAADQAGLGAGRAGGGSPAAQERASPGSSGGIGRYMGRSDRSGSRDRPDNDRPDRNPPDRGDHDRRDKVRKYKDRHRRDLFIYRDRESFRPQIVIVPPPEDRAAPEPEPEPAPPPDPGSPFSGMPARGGGQAGHGIAVGRPLPEGLPHVTLDWRTYDLPRPPRGQVYARVRDRVVLIDPADRRVTRIFEPGAFDRSATGNGEGSE